MLRRMKAIALGSLRAAAAAGLVLAGLVLVDRGNILLTGNILDIGRGGHRAEGSQGSGCMPTTGTVSGLTFAQDVNAAIAALISSNSGASAPATDCTAVAIKGQVWLDTSTTPNIFKQYDGTSWVVIGYLDSTNHIWTPPLGGGTNSLSSASTVDLGSVPQAYVSVSGSTGPITSFGSSAVAGTLKVVVFASTPTITHNATSMILPTAADLTAAAGDVWIVAHLGSGNWRVVAVQLATGAAVLNPARDVGDIWHSFAVSAPAKAVLAYGQPLSRATYPEFLAATTVAQNGTRTSGSAVITSLSDTGQLGADMPVEGSGIPAATTILSVDSATQITLSANATTSGTSTVTVFPNGYGSGGTSSTVGAPDCRGVTMAGRSNMGGTNNGNYTTSFAGKNGQALGSSFGSEKQTLSIAQLPVVTPAGTISLSPNPPTISGGADAGAATFVTVTANNNNRTVNLNSFTATFTGTPFGSGNAHPITPPTKIANCFVRVLP